MTVEPEINLGEPEAVVASPVPPAAVLPTTVTVQAPSTLQAGYTFEAVVDGKTVRCRRDSSRFRALFLLLTLSALFLHAVHSHGTRRRRQGRRIL